ncbi:tripartite tricarboxylate transporter TctB family protein [[Pasteurella] aerogenes]
MMKISLRQDLVGSFVFLIISILLWILIPSQIILDDTQDSINAQTFPRLVIGLMGFCSLILFIQEVIKLIKKEPSKIIEIDIHTEFNAIVIILLLILYWVLLNWLSFMASSIIFSFLMLIFFHSKNWKYYFIVAFIIIAVSLFFNNVLDVALP